MGVRVGAWVRRSRGGLLAAAIIALGAGARVALVMAGWPGTDSDDSTMGLMALHILTRGERPIFFYGQAYMGTIEAYLGALMFALFGVSLVALKSGLIVLYAGFMALMYPLLAGLFSRRWALAGLLLLSLGSADMLYQQLNAYGGYLETLFFGALMLLVAYWLARGGPPFATRRARLAGYAVWGLAAGLGFWSDPLVAPFVAVSALLLAAFAPREARGRAGLIAVVALLVGVSPWLVYIVAAHSPQAATSFLQRLPQATPPPAPASGHPIPAPPPLQAIEPLAAHLAGVVVVAVPNETGASGVVCQIASGDLWPFAQWGRDNALCLVGRGLWGAGYLALLALAMIVEARALLRLWRVRRGDGGDGGDGGDSEGQSGRAAWERAQRAGAARAGVRLAALLAPAATLLLFALSSSSASFPWIFDRYLISLLIATPVMLGSLVERAVAGKPAAKGLAAAKPTSAGWIAKSPLSPWGRGLGVRSLPIFALSVGMLAALAVGVVGAWRQTPAEPVAMRVQHDLIRRLVADGETRVYSEFWTCYRLIFLSDERVVCSVLNTDLSARPSRWAPYDALVAATPNPAYVFPLRSSQAVNLLATAHQHGWRVSVTIVDNVYGIFRVAPPDGTSGASSGGTPGG